MSHFFPSRGSWVQIPSPALRETPANSGVNGSVGGGSDYRLPHTSPTNRHKTPASALLRLLAAAAIVLALLLATGEEPADASGYRGPVIATWYGPGLYYNRFACADGPGGLPDYYTPNVRGVAHRTLPCGTWMRFRRNGRGVRAQVIDRGPYSAATFDFTAATAIRLCGCSKPFTMNVYYKKGY